METLSEILRVPLVSVLVGAGVTWLVAWRYYCRAGAELREESRKLRQATDLVIYCLTNKDAKVTANYDANGNVSGLTVSASGVANLFDASTGYAHKVRPNPSLHLTCYSGLCPLPHAGDLKR